MQLLSGLDYPARPEADLEEHLVPGRSYVNFYPMLPGSQFDTIPHTWCFHDQYALLPDRWGRRAYRLVDRLNRRLPARTPPVTLYRGSVWMCLARPAAEYVVGATRDREHRRVMRYLRTINVPDEIAVQTLLAHSPLATTLDGWEGGAFRPEEKRVYHHYIDWDPDRENPAVLDLDDLPAIRASGQFFVRKVSPAAPHGSWTSSTRLSADRGARPLPPARRAARSTSRLPSTSSLQAVAPPSAIPGEPGIACASKAGFRPGSAAIALEVRPQGRGGTPKQLGLDHARRQVVAARMCQDAAEFQPDQDDVVFFLFNPFDDVVLAAALGSIEASLRQRRRPVHSVYHAALHRQVIEAGGAWTRSGQEGPVIHFVPVRRAG